MAVISGNASLSGSIQLNSGNNRSSSTIDRQQAQSIIILPSSNSYRQNSLNPANTNYDSWNSSSQQQPNYNNYTNTDYTNNSTSKPSNQELWNVFSATLNTLSHSTSNKTATPQSNENLSYVAKTLTDTLKTNGSLSSNGLQNQSSPYFDYNYHHSNHATNSGLTSSREHNYTNPNSSYHHSNYSGNGGLTSSREHNYNYTNANSTNNISVYQAPDGSFIISLPPDTTSSNYNTTNASHSYRYSPDYSNLNNNNPNINWPPNLQHNSTIRLSI